jgi:hypothetical protein
MRPNGSKDGTSSRKCFAAIALAFALFVMLPASAGAATTVGTTFDPVGSSCGTNFLALQTGSPSDLYAVPSAGVLTSWSYQASTLVPNLRLKVARATADPDQFFIVGESSIKAPVASSTNIYSDISIPVQAGDFLGMRTSSAGDCGNLTGGAGYVTRYGGTDPGANTTVALSNLATDDVRLDISATLEADCDGDVLGDETEDGDTDVCNPVLDPIGAKSVVEGQTLSFPVTASDTNGDTLTYAATNLPPGASYNSGTHTFSWTPTAGQAGSYPGVHFSVDDGTLVGTGPALKSDSEDVTITVSAPPPVVPPIGTSTATGRRAAALKKCKKKKSATARKKCKKNAKKLPV